MTKSQGIAAAKPIVLDDDVKQQFLERIAEEPLAGHVKLLRELGVQGTAAQIREARDKQLGDAIKAVRQEQVLNVVLGRAIYGDEQRVYYKGDEVDRYQTYDSRAQELAARLLDMLNDRFEVSGTIVGQLEIEGRVQLGFEELFRRRAELGLGDPGGLGAAGDRRALPAASDVLPDPAAD